MACMGSGAFQLVRFNSAQACESCRCRRTVSVNLIQKYVQFVGVPFLPRGQISALTCEACGFSAFGDEIPSSFASEVLRVSGYVPTPLWTFSGALFLGSLVVSGACVLLTLLLYSV